MAGINELGQVRFVRKLIADHQDASRREREREIDVVRILAIALYDETNCESKQMFTTLVKDTW